MKVILERPDQLRIDESAVGVGLKIEVAVSGVKIGELVEGAVEELTM